MSSISGRLVWQSLPDSVFDPVCRASSESSRSRGRLYLQLLASILLDVLHDLPTFHSGASLANSHRSESARSPWPLTPSCLHCS